VPPRFPESHTAVRMEVPKEAGAAASVTR